MNESIIFTLARLLSCCLFAGSGLYQLFHRQETVKTMISRKVPFAAIAYWPIIGLDLVGTMLLVANQYVWAVALSWIAFTVVSTALYHFRIYTADGGFDNREFLQVMKALSIIGGLLALILLDPATPQWLLSRGLPARPA